MKRLTWVLVSTSFVVGSSVHAQKEYQKPRVMINVLSDIFIHWAQNVFHLFTAKLYSPMVKLVNLVGLTWVLVIARKNYPRDFSGP